LATANPGETPAPIKPYTAVGLIPTVRGIRKRADIRVNLEHLKHLRFTEAAPETTSERIGCLGSLLMWRPPQHFPILSKPKLSTGVTKYDMFAIEPRRSRAN
jgi:hypothetical protein